MKARLPKEFQNKGAGNMNSMMKQAQKMQEDIQRVQAELEEREFTATAGGGAIELVMTGGKQLKSVKIKPEVVDPEDVEMLEDIVLSGVNEMLRVVDEEGAKEMEKVTGGMSMPGLF